MISTARSRNKANQQHAGGPVIITLPQHKVPAELLCRIRNMTAYGDPVSQSVSEMMVPTPSARA